MLGTDLLAKNEITDDRGAKADYVLTFDDRRSPSRPIKTLFERQFQAPAGRPITWPRTCST